MVEYTPNTRPADQGRPNPNVHETAPNVRETTVVKSGNSNGVAIGIVLVVVVAIAGYLFLSNGSSTAPDTVAPAAETNMEAAPPATAEPDAAMPAPAPEMPAELAPPAATDSAPAAPAPAPNN